MIILIPPEVPWVEKGLGTTDPYSQMPNVFWLFHPLATSSFKSQPQKNGLQTLLLLISFPRSEKKLTDKFPLSNENTKKREKGKENWRKKGERDIFLIFFFGWDSLKEEKFERGSWLWNNEENTLYSGKTSENKTKNVIS